jgi:hypothetical protein
VEVEVVERDATAEELAELECELPELPPLPEEPEVLAYTGAAGTPALALGAGGLLLSGLVLLGSALLRRKLV